MDAEWKIPHFEKMLYDNALLISLYSEFYRSEAGALRRDLVRRTVEWLLGEMRVADTAFACSLAAESEGREGAYYLFDPAEVHSVLGDAADEFRAQYLDSSADFEGGKVLNRFGEASAERNQKSPSLPIATGCSELGDDGRVPNATRRSSLTGTVLQSPPSCKPPWCSMNRDGSRRQGLPSPSWRTQ